MENQKYFYYRFMNQANYDRIESWKTKKRFNTMYFSLLAFSLAEGIVAMVFGISFANHVLPRSLLIANFVFMSFAVIPFIVLIFLNFKYHVYRNWWSFLLLTLPCLATLFGFFTYSACNTVFTNTKDKLSITVPFNPVVFFGVIALYFGFVVFVYYASMKMYRLEILRQWKTVKPE